MPLKPGSAGSAKPLRIASTEPLVPAWPDMEPHRHPKPLGYTSASHPENVDLDKLRHIGHPIAFLARPLWHNWCPHIDTDAPNSEEGIASDIRRLTGTRGAQTRKKAPYLQWDRSSTP